MAIDRQLWLRSFSKDDLPNWNCPTCGKGSLQLITDSFHRNLDANSRRATETHDLDERTTKIRYSLMLECNNEKCKDIVASIGYGKFDDDSLHDHMIPLTEEYSPKYFLPHLLIFPISSKCPDNVAAEIKNSFKLFFADPPASANYIRKAVEEILTERGIRRYAISKGKRVPINLHNRILEFEKKKPELAKKLFAIKWLGNEGSHADTISKNDVLDAYEILEFLLDDLYVGYRKSVEKKVSKINKTKKALHPST